MKRLTYFVAIIITLTTCVEPYNIKDTNYEKVLVVSGSISNNEGPYFVSLSHTYPLDGTGSTLIRNAALSVKDGLGNYHDFVESDSGLYVSPPSLRGIVGEEYQLIIETEGKQYESETTTLKVSPEIDRIHHIYTDRLSEGGTDPVTGIQFFVDTSIDSDTPAFFRYEWEDTYRIDAPYPSLWDFNFDDSTYILRDVAVGRCFSSGKSADILLANTAESSVNKVADFPIRFISEERQALRTRYSILVRQFAIDEANYNFYRQIKKSNENGGSLNAEQIGTIIGNISSLDDPSEIVLGYFEVAGMTEKRAFFNPNDFDDNFRTPSFLFNCIPPDFIEAPQDTVAFLLTVSSTRRIVDVNSVTQAATMTDRSCSDCSWYASTIEPDFWID